MDALLTLYKEHQSQNVLVVDREEVQYVVGEVVLGVVVVVRLEDEGVLGIGEVGADVEVASVLGEVEEDVAETLISPGLAAVSAVVAKDVCI